MVDFAQRGDLTMPYSEAQKRATAKYNQAHYDRLELQLKKGMKEVYRAQAAAHGMSLNAYIISLLDADAHAVAAERTTPPPAD